MLARKEQESLGTALPEVWTQEVKELMETTYQQNCQQFQRHFEVIGLTYPNELLFTVSFIDNHARPTQSPYTFMASVDLDTQINTKKVLNTLVDSAGLFFDQYFANYPEVEYQVVWEKTEVNGLEFYYKVSREDIGLTLQAEALLQKNK